QGNFSNQLVGVAATVPLYLMAARSGNTFTGYTSTDGTTWTPIAGSSFAFAMIGPVLAGLAVTSHNSGTASAVTYDTVVFSNTPPSPVNAPCVAPAGFTCADIGNPALAGNQTLVNTTWNNWTVQGSGNDVWGTFDQFHFVWQPLATGG